MSNDPVPEQPHAAGVEKEDLFAPVGKQVEGIETVSEDKDEPQIVDVIESLCMNCEENVRLISHKTWIDH